MYENIGKKIKGLAKGIFIAEAIGMFVAGIALMAIDDNLIIYGLIMMLLGPVVAWVSSWLLYGFGELIDKTSDIERNTRGRKSVNAAEDNFAESTEAAEEDSARIAKLKRLLDKGLITEEEYENAINK
jgi:biopolymer transport protein ExbB/TolQ